MMILLAALVAALMLAAYFGRRAFHQPVGNPYGSAVERHDWAKSNMLGSAMVWSILAALVLIVGLAFGAPPAHAAALHRTLGEQPQRLRALDRLADRICGPDGFNDWNDAGPVCERWGWDGHRYRAMCAGPKRRISDLDPWLRAWLIGGDTLKDAKVELADNRINTCD